MMTMGDRTQDDRSQGKPRVSHASDKLLKNMNTSQFYNFQVIDFAAGTKSKRQ
jgi:hypothetical protein